MAGIQFEGIYFVFAFKYHVLYKTMCGTCSKYLKKFFLPKTEASLLGSGLALAIC